MAIKRILKLSALLVAFSNIAFAEEYADIATREQVDIYNCIDANMTNRQRAGLDNIFSKEDGDPSTKEVVSAEGFTPNFLKCLKKNGSLIMKDVSTEEGESFINGIVLYAAAESAVRRFNIPEVPDFAEEIRQLGKEALLKENRKFYGDKKEPEPEYEGTVVLMYACYFAALVNSDKEGTETFSKMIGLMAEKNDRIKQNKDEYFIKGSDALKVEMERYGDDSVKLYKDFCAEQEVAINNLFDDGMLE